jgi:ribosomal protein L12E/L44/L45/RPP1/RPP2
MKHLAAYLLLHLTLPAPTKEDVTDLLATVGIQPDIEKLDKLYKLLEGRDINEVISPPKHHRRFNCS